MATGQEYEDEDFVEAVRESPSSLAATSEVANRLGCTTEWARQKLNDAYERGDLSGKHVKPNTIIWEARGDA